jgi:hypothetical protein
MRPPGWSIRWCSRSSTPASSVGRRYAMTLAHRQSASRVVTGRCDRRGKSRQIASDRVISDEPLHLRGNPRGRGGVLPPFTGVRRPAIRSSVAADGGLVIAARRPCAAPAAIRTARGRGTRANHALEYLARRMADARDAPDRTRAHPRPQRMLELHTRARWQTQTPGGDKQLVDVGSQRAIDNTALIRPDVRKPIDCGSSSSTPDTPRSSASTTPATRR